MSTRTPYPSYKPSGVDWLCDIPSHWQNRKLKTLGNLRAGSGITSESIESKGTYPVYGGNGIRGYSEAWTHAGDMALIGRQGALCGNVHLVSGKFWASEHAIVFHPVSDVHIGYFHRVLRTMDLGQYSIAAAQPGIGVESIKDLSAPLPPLDEQRAIADYLDRKDAQISRFIESRRRMIALLEEKKQAVVNQAVTRGLDPTVPMKDSGVEWLGEIPAHWEVGKLSRATHQIKPGPFGSQLSQSSLVPKGRKVYTQSNVISKDFASGNQFVNDVTWHNLRAFIAKPGDLLVSARGTIGKSFILPEGAPSGLIHPSLIKVQSDEKVLSASYLSKLLEGAPNLRQYFLLMSNATTIDVIYAGTLGASRIPVPPKSEQQEICMYADGEAFDASRIVDRFTRQIELMREYRTRLISDVVTGKMRVT